MSFAPHDGTARLLDAHGQVLATLTRVRFPDLVEEQERVTFRAPYGTTVHVRGRGSIRPPTLRLRGVLQGPATTVDDQLQALQATLRVTNNLWIGDWLIPVRSAGGHITFSPTLNGWAVEVPLRTTGEEWLGLVRDGLVAEYRFDEGSGTTLKDFAGNGYDGSITGGSWSTSGLALGEINATVTLGGGVPFGPTGTVMHVFRVEQLPPISRDGMVRFVSLLPGGSVLGYFSREPDGLMKTKWGIGLESGAFRYTNSPSHDSGSWEVSVLRQSADGGGTISVFESSHGSFPNVTQSLTAQGDFKARTVTEIGRNTYGDYVVRHAFVALYDRALSDAEVVQNVSYLKLALTSREVTLL